MIRLLILWHVIESSFPRRVFCKSIVGCGLRFGLSPGGFRATFDQPFKLGDIFRTTREYVFPDKLGSIGGGPSITTSAANKGLSIEGR